MKDLLTFVPNINVFRQALKDLDSSAFVYVNEKTNDVKLLIPSIPVRYKGNKTLTLLACTSEAEAFLESIPSVDIIGEHKERTDDDYTFVSDTAGRNKYAQVYDRTPREVPNGEGGTITYTPPKMIGVFFRSN
jgi:hypothetical protein